MTPIRDEPAVAWLSPDERTRVETMVTLLWALFWIAALLGLLCFNWIFSYLFLFSGVYALRYSIVALIAAGAAVFRAVRRAILRMRSERIELLLRHNAAEVAADDWTALAAEPNDTIASVVGWVRGRQRFDKPIGGEPAVGVALP